MAMADHETLRESIEPYALGLLSDDERRAFEAHLEGCADCTREVRALAAVTEALALSVEQRLPPVSLRARVIDATGGAPRREGRNRSRTTAPAWLLIAASTAAVVLGGYAVLQRMRVERAATISTRAADILGAGDVRLITLTGQEVAPAAAGKAFWSRSRGVMFTATNLPPLPRGKTYQLWVVTSTAPLSAGLITPDASGRAMAVADMPESVQPVAVALTIEPDGGVPSPTGAKYLVGAL
jgi:anti-sigma-K factor RskA